MQILNLEICVRIVPAPVCAEKPDKTVSPTLFRMIKLTQMTTSAAPHPGQRGDPAPRITFRVWGLTPLLLVNRHPLHSHHIPHPPALAELPSFKLLFLLLLLHCSRTVLPLPAKKEPYLFQKILLAIAAAVPSPNMSPFQGRPVGRGSSVGRVEGRPVGRGDGSGRHLIEYRHTWPRW